MILFTETSQIRRWLPFSASYDTNRILPLLESTEETYIRPLLGDSLMEDISLHEVLSDKCRRACVNIMAYLNFTLLNTQILPGGFAQMTGDNVDRLYKYQENELKNIFRRDGFDALDEIAVYLENNATTFPEWGNTEFALSRVGYISSRKIVEEYYKKVGYLAFLHLQVFFNRVESLDLPSSITVGDLKEKLITGAVLTETETKLLKNVRGFIVCLGVAEAIEERGINISETAVWYETINASSDASNQVMPDNAIEIASLYRRYAERYAVVAKALTETVDHDPFKRDNTGKRTFWM